MLSRNQLYAYLLLVKGNIFTYYLAKGNIFYFENLKGNLSAEDIEIWQNNFIGLTVQEFKTIRKISNLKLYDAGDKLISMGEKNEYLYFVNSGNLSVEKNKNKITNLSQGDIAGEMSFITDSLPNADVIANEETNCVIINKDELKSVMIKNPTLHLSITNLFNINLTKKLA